VTTPDALLLDLYDRQFRRSSDRLGRPAPHDGGPLVRWNGGRHGVIMGHRADLGVTGTALDDLIRRQIARAAADGEPVGWKVHGHDRPAELADRLLAAGFTTRHTASVLVGETAAQAGEPAALTGGVALPDGAPLLDGAPLPDEVPLPDGVTIRRTTDPADADRIAAQHSEVWGADLGFLAEVLKERLVNRAESIPILLAEAADGTLVCSGWLLLRDGSDFATLLGGTTLPGWQGRGIYRALVAQRARIAAQHGYRYLHVDASDASAPILRRLGFRAITTATQYTWEPAPAPSPNGPAPETPDHEPLPRLGDAGINQRIDASSAEAP
jgi:GNAT superfamily N-acetyltransferase